MKIDNLKRGFEIVSEYRNLKHSSKTMLAKIYRITLLAIEYQFLDFYFGIVPPWRLIFRFLSFKERSNPDTLIICPSKSGSSDLICHVMSHPNILGPLAKEFDIPDPNSLKSCLYPSQSKVLKMKKKLGQVRNIYHTPYLQDIATLDKFYEINPNSKVVVALRDPVDRAYSNWKWEVFLSGSSLIEMEILRDFSSFVNYAISVYPLSAPSISGLPFLHAGIYYKAVEILINKFGRDNTLVVDMTEYFEDRRQVLNRISDFLNVPQFSISQVSNKVNANPLQFQVPSNHTVDQLSEFYKPYNNRLFDLLDEQYNWK